MLIVFEGLHSAGKSTQVAALEKWLRDRGASVTLTSWNSSPSLGATITGLKMANALSPIAMVLMEAADLAYRYEHGLCEALDGKPRCLPPGDAERLACRLSTHGSWR
jgi:dTMP kinase